MIDHISLAVSDPETSKAFYTKALAPIDCHLVMEFGEHAGLGQHGKPELWLVPSNGAVQKTHLALAASSRAQVDAFHKAALEAGGKDNGGPGLRSQYHPNYYGAFVFDPDGHNLEVVCHRSE